MTWYKKAKNDKPENWDEMVKWFKERTNKHIDLVKKNCKKLANYDDKWMSLVERGELHDKSKFKNPEFEPYVYITWKYKCADNNDEFECPEGMEEKMKMATTWHITNPLNQHHPECHCDQTENLINENDRDKPPEKMIDATKMKDIDIAELVCDWCAVSEERGGSPRTWAKNNIGTRWDFSEDQEELIYDLIDVLWD